MKIFCWNVASIASAKTSRCLATLLVLMLTLYPLQSAWAQGATDDAGAVSKTVYLPLIASANQTTTASDAYHFPVMPGSDAWAQFETHQAMLDATQIPTDVLHAMSTKGLVETVLAYPLFGDLLAFNNTQQGFDAVKGGFNGLAELLNRPEAGHELFARYQAMDPANVKASWSLEEQGAYDLSFTYLETLLAQDAMLNNFNEAERTNLLAETFTKFQSKQVQNEVYGHFGRERSAVVMGRVLQKNAAAQVQAASNPELQTFLADASFASDQVLAQIVGLAQQHLTGAPVEVDAAATNDYAGYVSTPRGSKVLVTVMTYELTAAQIAASNQSVATNYPRATRETNASRRYNCHSYAWVSQSTSNTVWLNAPNQATYWNDGSYKYLGWAYGSIGVPSGVATGTRVSYPSSSDHSAIVASTTKFRSKWGQLPRMLHTPAYAPYGSYQLYYFR